MAHPMSVNRNAHGRVTFGVVFDRRLKLEFHGSKKLSN